MRALPYLFDFWAMPHQLPPDGDWRTWVVMGGRGAGKTRAGAEWIRAQVEGDKPSDPGQARRVALVGETIEQAREVMVFGESGIMACTPPDRTPLWHATRKVLEWPNGATAQLISAQQPESLRGPQFDAAWVDEIGCAAVDKGPNEPNKFVDVKSSESDLPRYSNGRRDELAQYQCLSAIHDFWADAANNPVSTAYGAPMVDTGRMHVWAWDARPYPQFPNDVARWSDGDNYYRGHWLNGRVGARTVAGVLREICAQSGVVEPVTERAYGLVRGYSVTQVGSGREAMQPILLAHGVDAIEVDGQLEFRSRDGEARSQVAEADMLATDATDVPVKRMRLAGAEALNRLRVSYVDADGSFDLKLAEASIEPGLAGGDEDAEIGLVMTGSAARSMAQRWLAEARLANETLHFALPPSRSELGAGDVISVEESGEAIRYRIDRITFGEGREIEAVRVDQSVYTSSDTDDKAPPVAAFVPPTPVASFLMDLPHITGTEQPQNPRLAVVSDPWPGEVAVYTAPNDNGYELATLLNQRATLGVTESDLAPAQPGLWDRGAALKVRLVHGTLSSQADVDVLNGRNLMAIGDGSARNWEIFQFEQAVLLPDGTYELSKRLRGQAGTDGLAKQVWPTGSIVVALDPLPVEIGLPSGSRGLARHYLIGPSNRPISDPVYEHIVEAVDGVALRPFAPAHLRVRKLANGEIEARWVRRTRVDGDSWQGMDVPLGEETEQYLVRVWAGGAMLREAVVGQANWTYGPNEQALDGGVSGPIVVQVAQLSTQFGPGSISEVSINV